MSTEIERRLKTLEKSIFTASECAHGVALRVVYSAEERESARAELLTILEKCGRHNGPSFGKGPALVFLLLAEEARQDLI